MRTRSQSPRQGSHRRTRVLGGHAFLWAIALNSLGTVFLVGGSLLSILRRQRVRANVWIACGALTVARGHGRVASRRHLARHARGADRNRTDVLRLHAERAREEGAATGGNTCLPGGPGTVNTEALHRHAEIVVEHELRRARRRLAGLPPNRRGEVEELALRVANELVDAVLDQARQDPILEQALRSIYGEPAMARELRALSCVSD